MRLESVMMMPARMCLTGCARPWFTFSQLTGSPIWTPVSLFQTLSQCGGWDWGWVLWASDATRKAKTGHATWCLTKWAQLEIALHVFFKCPPTVLWDSFAFVPAGAGGWGGGGWCGVGGGPHRLPVSIKYKSFYVMHIVTPPFCLFCEGTWLAPTQLFASYQTPAQWDPM